MLNGVTVLLWVFNMIPTKGTVNWNTYHGKLHAWDYGKGEEALLLFEKMLDLRAKPNSVTFTGVLSGCSHSQLVDKGLLIFDSISSNYSTEPDADHYSFMVFVLDRVDWLEEA
ncbi:hypothetical protein SO802_010268 [Lithocarpus litseifolius]|uniref:Pentatricopeptide repeat-containing protein n=1 Tax=Lithocarpus litseifolius TaxID=425828 RepID=A0AAW2DJD0_9ROSI